MEQPKYKRVILKLSGEALAGEVGFGLEGDVLNSMAVQVKELVEAGVEVAIVVGGGNIWRGVTGAKRAWFQKENENCKRPQGSEEKTRKMQSKTLLLIHLNGLKHIG